MSLRLAVLPDFVEEGWLSMDLCAEELLRQARTVSGWEVTRTIPNYQQPFNLLGRKGQNLNRAWNRYWHYPRFAKKLLNQHDFFHIVDHSYAHLAHQLPPERTGVYCHDLDAFRSLIEPDKEPRGRVFRWLMRRILTGMQRATVVFVNSEQTAAELERFKLIDPAKIVRTPLGLSPEFQPSSTPPEPFTLLHVGSCIPRKRVDVLLKVFAKLRETVEHLKLIKVGGDFTPEQTQIIQQYALEPHIEHLKGLTRTELAQQYQKASVVLVTSEAEGFGLPVIEALACGSVVVASDIAPLREGGGPAAVYAPVADVEAWAKIIRLILNGSGNGPSREVRLQQASRFSWARHARIILEAYQRIRLQ